MAPKLFPPHLYLPVKKVARCLLPFSSSSSGGQIMKKQKTLQRRRRRRCHHHRKKRWWRRLGCVKIITTAAHSSSSTTKRDRFFCPPSTCPFFCFSFPSQPRDLCCERSNWPLLSAALPNAAGNHEKNHETRRGFQFCRVTSKGKKRRLERNVRKKSSLLFFCQNTWEKV